MTRKRAVETDRITCQDDAGNRVTVIERTTMIQPTSLNDTTKKELSGMKEYLTSDGQHVNRRDEGTFEIVGTETIVRPIE